MLLACSASACAGLEGLDPYQLCASDCPDAGLVDASAGSAPPPSDAGSGKPVGEASSSDVQSPDGPSAGPQPDASPRADGGPVTDAGLAPDGGCTCVSQAPSGWTGYVQIVLGDGGAASCAAPYSSALGTKKTAPAGSPAQCTPCTCGFPPSGPIQCEVSLGAAGLLCANEVMTVAPSGLCVVPPGPVGATSGPNGDSYGPNAVPAPAGPCSPAGGTLAQPLAPAQSSSAVVCGPSTSATASCSRAGETCVPAPSPHGGSPSGVCIYQSGTQSCPAGSFTTQIVVASAVVDTRACMASCACAPPGCPSDGYVQGFTSADCTGTAATTFDASTPCVLGDNANGSVSFKYTPSHSAWNGSCAATGGGATGSVSLDTATTTTYCCIP